ncbi:hypothetical protein CWE02_10080 [Brucella pituitosa]|nr:hypothetical protein CWE02_10080 [Brucella pituitosa]
MIEGISMKPRRFTEPQIPGILHQEEDGVPVPELCRLGVRIKTWTDFTSQCQDSFDIRLGFVRQAIS